MDTNRNQGQPQLKQTQAQILASLDLFSLLGLKKQKIKAILLADILENVWLEILGNKVPFLLVPSDLLALRDLMEKTPKTQISVIFDFLKSKIPNFSQVIVDTSLKYKKVYFLDYLENLQDKLNTRLTKLTNNKAGESSERLKSDLQKQLGLTREIQALVQTDNWAKVQELLPIFNNQKQLTE